MSERYIKYIPSERAAWLRSHKTSLYLLLSLAAERARWTDDPQSGLLSGDAILGSFEEAGISRKQYRDALEDGEKLGVWEIVWNEKNKKQQKRAIRRTIKTFVVNIKCSDVWDLNINHEGQQKGQPRANSGPTEGHIQEQTRIVSIKEQQQPVAVFPCLFRIEDPIIDEFHRKQISEQYDEQTVIDAVAAITIPGFKPKDNMLMSLRAACKGKWKPKEGSTIDVIKNYELAKTLENTTHAYKFFACRTYLEIIKGPITECIQYEMSYEKFYAEVEEKGKINLKTQAM